MKRTLKRIAPLKLGIFAGTFYALFSLILIPFILLGALVSAIAPHPTGSGGAAATGLGIGFALIFAIMAPIIYGVMGFIFGALGGLIYNLIASWMGGIEVEVE